MSEKIMPGGARTNMTIDGYVRGLALALVLTVAAFLLAGSRGLDSARLTWSLAGLALAQVAVHLVCFLHLGRSADQRWNRIALIFAAIFVALVVGGSMWIMQHLDHNMMPTPMGD